MDFGRLLGRMAAGAAGFSEPVRRRHAHGILRSESPEGGFVGRAGKSDLYYTSFGLAGLALLGQLSEETAQRTAQVLVPADTLAVKTNVLVPAAWDSLSLAEVVGLAACWAILEAIFGLEKLFGSETSARWRPTVQERVREFLTLVQRPDGGYAKHPRSPTSSTYATFLAGLVQQWIGLPIGEPEKTAPLLLARQRDDGGFAEWPSVQYGGTNPTAAAVGWWSLTGRIPTGVRDRAAAFLASMQIADGGLRSHGRAPFSDLLSTFTGLAAMELLEAGHAVDRRAARQYIASLELAEGGFRAGFWDASADVEYTFYGLAGLALLAEAADPT